MSYTFRKEPGAFQRLICLITACLFCSAAHAQTTPPTADETLGYITNKFEIARYTPTQWYAVKVIAPWVVFEWKSRPGGKFLNHAAIDLRCLKIKPEAIEADEDDFIVFRNIDPACIRFESTSKKRQEEHDQTPNEVKIGVPLLTPEDALAVVRALRHLINVVPAQRSIDEFFEKQPPG